MVMVVMVRSVYVMRGGGCGGGGRGRQATAAGHGGGRRLLRRRCVLSRSSRSDLVAQNPTDAGHAGHVELVAHAVGQQSVANLPREHARVLALQPADVSHHPGRGHPGLAASDGPGQDASGLVVPGQDLGHATVGDAQLTADVARSDAHPGQFDDAHANGVGQRPTVDEHAAQLVHLAVLLLLLLVLLVLVMLEALLVLVLLQVLLVLYVLVVEFVQLLLLVVVMQLVVLMVVRLFVLALLLHLLVLLQFALLVLLLLLMMWQLLKQLWLVALLQVMLLVL